MAAGHDPLSGRALQSVVCIFARLALATGLLAAGTQADPFTVLVAPGTPSPNGNGTLAHFAQPLLNDAGRELHPLF